MFRGAHESLKQTFGVLQEPLSVKPISNCVLDCPETANDTNYAEIAHGQKTHTGDIQTPVSAMKVSERRVATFNMLSFF